MLTALTVAVLLAASSGTAWAQTIGFRQSRGTVEEGASTNTATEAPLNVTISRSGNFAGPPATAGEDPIAFPAGADHLMLSVVEYDGTAAASTDFSITYRSGDTTAFSTANLIDGSATFGFAAEEARTDGVATTIELSIAHTAADNGDWNDETLVLRVSATSTLTDHLAPSGVEASRQKRVRYGTRQLRLTVEDDDPMPTLRFGKSDIQLAKGNTQTVTVGVGIGAARGSGGGSIQATLFALDGVTGDATGDDVLLSVEPADAVGRIIKITKPDGNDADTDPDPLVARSPGRYLVSKIGGTGGLVPAETGSTDGITLTIEAIGASGFRDERISLTLVDGRTDAEKMGEGGPIGDSLPASVTVLSGEETPTVTFSKESVTIDEGGMETVHILADTDQGDKVGSVAVSVSGEATIVLEQGGNRISGGTVEFGGSANAELTIRALSDLTLEDGEEKMATVTITDAGGANIGDPRSLTVTVIGSTAVPVLPLVGQLLLAMLLMAGGARLYRRRQQ
ncbi:MAG: hypothetical protein OXF27_15995 [Acidobacteria bacterium]|nr:hypothetical protein [Acidobacteriota bacterium]